MSDLPSTYHLCIDSQLWWPMCAGSYSDSWSGFPIVHAALHSLWEEVGIFKFWICSPLLKKYMLYLLCRQCRYKGKYENAKNVCQDFSNFPDDARLYKLDCVYETLHICSDLTLQQLLPTPLHFQPARWSIIPITSWWIFWAYISFHVDDESSDW